MLKTCLWFVTWAYRQGKVTAKSAIKKRIENEPWTLAPLIRFCHKCLKRKKKTSTSLPSTTLHWLIGSPRILPSIGVIEGLGIENGTPHCVAQGTQKCLCVRHGCVPCFTQCVKAGFSELSPPMTPKLGRVLESRKG